jgi:putative oxidoreductase
VAAPVEFFGGIALILGLATRYVAALLLLFVIIATLSSHRYWEFAEAAARRAQDNNFYKNLAIMGGLVFAFVTAGGRFSIDRPAVDAQVEPTAETDRPRGAGWDRRRAAGIGKM